MTAPFIGPFHETLLTVNATTGNRAKHARLSLADDSTCSSSRVRNSSVSVLPECDQDSFEVCLVLSCSAYKSLDC